MGQGDGRPFKNRVDNQYELAAAGKYDTDEAAYSEQAEMGVNLRQDFMRMIILFRKPGKIAALE